MSNHPYPRRRDTEHIGQYEYNGTHCIRCHRFWWLFAHPYSDYSVITRVCPLCVGVLFPAMPTKVAS